MAQPRRSGALRLAALDDQIAAHDCMIATDGDVERFAGPGRQLGEAWAHWEIAMRPFCELAGTVLLAAMLLVGPAAAQSSQQARWCQGKDDASPDLRISGCTAVIQSRGSSPKTLAIAF